jgi:hypothetical protein
VWVPATLVSLDALLNVHEDDGRRVIDRVAAAGPSLIERLMTAERIDTVAVKQLDAEIRGRALDLRKTVRSLLRRELCEIETVTWKRLAVLAALFPDLGPAVPHAWEIRLLTNVLREFPHRQAAIEQLPVRLRRLGLDVPTEWHTDPLTATNFGKLKSEIAKRWRQREPLLQETVTELLEPSLTETLDDIDEFLHRSRE